MINKYAQAFGEEYYEKQKIKDDSKEKAARTPEDINRIIDFIMDDQNIALELRDNVDRSTLVDIIRAIDAHDYNVHGRNDRQYYHDDNMWYGSGQFDRLVEEKDMPGGIWDEVDELDIPLLDSKLSSLVRAANRFDKAGQYKKADRIDRVLSKVAGGMYDDESGDIYDPDLNLEPIEDDMPKVTSVNDAKTFEDLVFLFGERWEMDQSVILDKAQQLFEEFKSEIQMIRDEGEGNPSAREDEWENFDSRDL